MLANLEDLPTNVQEIAQEHALIGTAKEDPQGAARLLETHNVATNSVANSIVDYWSESNPLEALDWVLSSPILEEKRRELAVRVIDRLAREQTDLAMKLALEQPTEWGLEAHVISTVAHSDAFEAMKLLPQLRDPAVAFPYDTIGYSLIEQGHAKSVLDVAKQVPEQTREAFYSNMTSNWAVHDPLGLLGMIDDLPTSSMQSKAAYTLSSQYHASTRYLMSKSNWRRPTSTSGICSV